MKTTFDIVVAADEEDGIGKGSDLPWRLPGDTKFLKRITSNTADASKHNAVIMGRKTFETIPPRFRPLKGRLNVVVTRNADYAVPDGAVAVTSIDAALAHIDNDPTIERTFVLGGGEIYRLAIDMPECRRIYLTRVEGKHGCDAFFPKVPASFTLHETSDRQEENNLGYTFQTFTKEAAE